MARLRPGKAGLRLVWGLALLGLGLALGWPAAAPAATRTLPLPISLDYPFVRSVLIYQAFTEPGQRAVAVDKDEGCTRIELWEPEVDREGSLIRVRTRIKVRAGVVVLGKCLDPVDWQGYIEVLQRLRLDRGAWRLGFETVDSRLYNQQRERTTVSKLLWNLIKTYVHAYLDQVTINLAPPVAEVENLLPLLFRAEDQARVRLWLNTLRPGQIQVEPDRVRVDILMDVEPPAPAEPSGEPEAALSELELARFASGWEAWDAFLVQQILSLGGQPLTEKDKEIILAVLLETRYQFVRVLGQEAPGPDLVRGQFLSAWQRLAPILRRYLEREPSRALLSYLAFFTAADALAALDSLGPTLGLDISREGLVRLARLLAAGQAAPVLDYTYAVNADLRLILGLGSPLDEAGPAFETDQLDLPGPEPDQPDPEATVSWLNLFGRPAWAAQAPGADLGQLLPFVPPEQDFGPYLERIRGVLAEAGEGVLARSELKDDHRELFRLLLPATAWQESCWRQFFKKGGRLRYLRSYNNTSVGLMQVNERVWRGMYQPQSLRWNIRYNARAGSEILELYLRRYALPKVDPGRPLEADVLARAVYAMYNGGPSQFDKFLKRLEKGTLYFSDQLFEEKYDRVKNDQFDQAADCLGGG